MVFPLWAIVGAGRRAGSGALRVLTGGDGGGGDSAGEVGSSSESAMACVCGGRKVGVAKEEQDGERKDWRLVGRRVW